MSITFPGYSPEAPLDLALSTTDAAALAARFADGTIDQLTDAIGRTHGCAHPIRLVGASHTINADTGEVLSSFTSADAPLGLVHVPCGNRRAHICPACSRTYARDTFEVIRTGVLGGKTVPESVAENPLLFVTLTAPSFGKVFREDSTARPCPHHHRRPKETTPGAPTCPECYDYTRHIVWQWFAPELWRRFTIKLHRALADRLGVPRVHLKEHASIQYAKVAEYQARGAIHFHVLIRLDGPKTPEGFTPAPAGITAAMFANLVRHVVPGVFYYAPQTYPADTFRCLRFGKQLDVRPVRDTRRTDAPGQPLTPEQVAGYLAKYVTKAVDGDADGPTAHYARLRQTAEDIARTAGVRARQNRADDPSIPPDKEADPYERLRKWTSSLGFRGHVTTKSRRYSITLGALRRARRRFQTLLENSRASGEPLDARELETRLLAENEEETTLVVGAWSYAGTGWRTEADKALALAVAARAREYAQWKATNRKNPTGHR